MRPAAAPTRRTPNRLANMGLLLSLFTVAIAVFVGCRSSASIGTVTRGLLLLRMSQTIERLLPVIHPGTLRQLGPLPQLADLPGSLPQDGARFVFAHRVMMGMGNDQFAPEKQLSRQHVMNHLERLCEALEKSLRHPVPQSRLPENPRDGRVPTVHPRLSLTTVLGRDSHEPGAETDTVSNRELRALMQNIDEFYGRDLLIVRKSEETIEVQVKGACQGLTLDNWEYAFGDARERPVPTDGLLTIPASCTRPVILSLTHPTFEGFRIIDLDQNAPVVLPLHHATPENAPVMKTMSTTATEEPAGLADVCVLALDHHFDVAIGTAGAGATAVETGDNPARDGTDEDAGEDNDDEEATSSPARSPEAAPPEPAGENLADAIPEPVTPDADGASSAPAGTKVLISFEVLDESSRRPVSGATVVVAGQAQTTDDNGDVTLSLDGGEPVTEALVYREGYSAQEIQLGNNLHLRQRVSLRAESATLSGVVRDPEQRPVANARVSCGTTTCITDAAGRYQFAGLTPSYVVFTIEAADRAARTETCYLDPGPGMRDFTLDAAVPTAWRADAGSQASN